MFGLLEISLVALSDVITLEELFFIVLIKGFRSYFKVVVLAPSLCGESSFRVIRDLSECIFSEDIINNSATKIRRTRRIIVCAHKTPLK